MMQSRARLCRAAILLLTAALPCACARPAPGPNWPAAAARVPSGRTIWVLDQGWHTEIGIQAADLEAPLSLYKQVFAGASVIMFGFGKRTWMTAKVDHLSELLVGPFPGPGAIEVIGLRTTPDRAFTGAAVYSVPLSPASEARLAQFVWQAIGRTAQGAPRLISQGRLPGSLFYAASQGYGLSRTCNRWTAEALAGAGLAVDPGGVVFASGVISQVKHLPGVRRL